MRIQCFRTCKKKREFVGFKKDFIGDQEELVTLEACINCEQVIKSLHDRIGRFEIKCALDKKDSRGYFISIHE